MSENHTKAHIVPLGLADAATALQEFAGVGLTEKLAKVEACLRSLNAKDCALRVTEAGASDHVLGAAALVKRAAGQINVVIHALGILLCLPHLLEENEIIDYVSLGAGNTGRPFDLETDQRIAEFKFIAWQGGPESIRQNSIFKDFYMLAESGSPKRKFLYVVGTEHPLKFLKGGRALASVLSRNDKVKQLFAAKYGDRFETVRNYYEMRKSTVTIQDVSPFLSALLSAEAGHKKH